MFGVYSIGVCDGRLRTRRDADAVSRHADSRGDATRNGDSDSIPNGHCRSHPREHGRAYTTIVSYPRTADARTDR